MYCDQIEYLHKGFMKELEEIQYNLYAKYFNVPRNYTLQEKARLR